MSVEPLCNLHLFHQVTTGYAWSYKTKLIAASSSMKRHIGYFMALFLFFFFLFGVMVLLTSMAYNSKLVHLEQK